MKALCTVLLDLIKYYDFGFILKHNFLEHSQKLMVKNDYAKICLSQGIKNS